MAIQTINQRKRQKNLMFVGLGLILITALVLYFGFLQKTPIPEDQTGFQTAVTTVPGVSTATEEKLKKINLDFEFLNEKIIPFLKIHGNIPVEIDEDEIGRNNPFVPY